MSVWLWLVPAYLVWCAVRRHPADDPTLGGRIVGRTPEVENAYRRHYRGPCKENEYWKSLGA